MGDGQVPWGSVRTGTPYAVRRPATSWHRAPGARFAGLVEEHAVVPAPTCTALDEPGQVDVLRAVALSGAESFGLVVRDLVLVLHASNRTFRVDTDDGRRFALRVTTNSHSTPDHIVAQQEWLHAVAAAGKVLVPDPLRTLHGHAEQFSVPAGGGLPVLDTPLFGDTDLLSGHADLSPGGADVVAAALGHTASAFATAHASGTPVVIRADLHGGSRTSR